MAKKKLGNKYACYQCGCKFYDLARPQPICPKCGADQTEAPKKEPMYVPKAATTAPSLSRSRSRIRRKEEDELEPETPFEDEDGETAEPLEHGLTMIDDEELIGSGTGEFNDED